MNTPLTGKKVQFPTRVLVLKNLLNKQLIEREEDYQDILDDMREEGQKFGRVMSVQVPKEELVIGNVYIEFYTVEEAREARRQLSGRKYNKKTVRIIYFPEEKYTKRELELPVEENINI